MHRTSNLDRRAFLATALAAVMLPHHAAASEISIASRYRMRTLGGLILDRLSGLPVDGEFFITHFRVRIAAEALMKDASGDHLDPRGVAIATVVAEELARKSKWSLEVIGHTAPGTSAFKDHVTSERLAESFRSVLMSRGIPLSKMTAHGAGSAKPVNDFAGGRIELIIRA